MLSAVTTLALLSFQLIQIATGQCDLSPVSEHVVELTQLNSTKYKILSICDFVILKLPPSLDNCAEYEWYLWSSLTEDAKKKKVSGAAHSKAIDMSHPENLGVYCTQSCQSEYYCAAITVVPVITSFTFNTADIGQECVVMQGETLRLICKSQGFPIRSSVIRQNNGQEVCPPIDSSANLVLVGQAAFGQLHHTCDITALQPGEHRFVCQVDFLPWEDNLVDFGTVTEAIQCSVLQGKHSASSSVSIAYSQSNVPQSSTTPSLTYSPSNVPSSSAKPSSSGSFVLREMWILVICFISFIVLLV